MSHVDFDYLDDLSFAPGLSLDLVRPSGPGPFPAVLWLHGGAWRMQDRKARPDLAEYFTRGGYVSVSSDYRLSGEAPFPAQLLDVRAALRFLRTHADYLHIDPERIGVWGSSAGGHLATLAAVTGHIAQLTHDEPSEDASVRAAVDGYGPADLADLDRNASADDPSSELLGGTVSEHPALAAQASPARRLTAAAPPILILHGTADDLVPLAHSERLFSAARTAGTSAALYRIEGFGHGFLNPGNVQELGPDHVLDVGRLGGEPNAPARISATPQLENFVGTHPHASFATILDFFDMTVHNSTDLSERDR